MKALLILALMVAIPITSTSKIRFDDYQVYRVIPKTIEQINVLRELEANPHGYDFWTDVSKIDQPVDIMVPPHLKYSFLDFLALQNLDVHVWIDNVQNLIDNGRSQKSRRVENYDWDEYPTLEHVTYTEINTK